MLCWHPALKERTTSSSSASAPMVLKPCAVTWCVQVQQAVQHPQHEGASPSGLDLALSVRHKSLFSWMPVTTQYRNNFVMTGLLRKCRSFSGGWQAAASRTLQRSPASQRQRFSVRSTSSQGSRSAQDWCAMACSMIPAHCASQCNCLRLRTAQCHTGWWTGALACSHLRSRRAAGQCWPSDRAITGGGRTCTHLCSHLA